MGFWLFMFAVDLLIPMIMFAAGKSFQKSAPKKINSIYGYRTEMSMKNRDTWEYAHARCGALWFKSSLILLPINLLSMLFMLGKTENIVGCGGLVLLVLNAAVMFTTIPLTESALQKTFNSDGSRKKALQ